MRIEEITEREIRRAEDALHFARKHEQRVWGSGSDHEKARAEVERLEARLEAILNWPLRPVPPCPDGIPYDNHLVDCNCD